MQNAMCFREARGHCAKRMKDTSKSCTVLFIWYHLMVWYYSCTVPPPKKNTKQLYHSF